MSGPHSPIRVEPHYTKSNLQRRRNRKSSPAFVLTPGLEEDNDVAWKAGYAFNKSSIITGSFLTRTPVA